MRLERGGTDHQHLADARLAGQDLRRADALDRLAQAHVVGQNGPAGARREGDPFKLIGQKLDLQQFRPQGVLRGVRADLGHLLRHPLLKQPPLDQLLGVGIDRHAAVEPLQLAHELDQLPHVLDRAVNQLGGEADRFWIGLVRQLQVQRHLFAIQHVDQRLPIAIGLPPLGRGEPPPHTVQ